MRQLGVVPSEAPEAAVEQAPALEAELDEASGDGETVTVVPALDVEAARVRIAEPFGALVHIDWLEMKNGSKAHGIAARALLITAQETEFLGVLPSKRKLASDVVRALHDLDDPGSLAIRRLLSDRAPEFVSAGRTFAVFSTLRPLRHSAVLACIKS